MNIIDAPIPRPTKPAKPLPIRRIQPKEPQPQTKPGRPTEVPAPERKAA